MMLRAWISFTLVVMLLVTSQSMAAVRGASAATDQMVICSGTQTLTIYVDATGAPTAAPHFCPDCALADFASSAQPVWKAPHVVRPSYLSRSWHVPVRAQALRLGKQSRAPPEFV